MTTRNYVALHLYSADVLTSFGERVEFVAARDADDAADRLADLFGSSPLGEPILIEEYVDIEEA